MWKRSPAVDEFPAAASLLQCLGSPLPAPRAAMYALSSHPAWARSSSCVIDSLAKNRRKTKSMSKSPPAVGRSTVPSRNEPCGYTSESPMPWSKSQWPRSFVSTNCYFILLGRDIEFLERGVEQSRGFIWRLLLGMGELLAIEGGVRRGECWKKLASEGDRVRLSAWARPIRSGTVTESKLVKSFGCRRVPPAPRWIAQE